MTTHRTFDEGRRVRHKDSDHVGTVIDTRPVRHITPGYLIVVKWDSGVSEACTPDELEVELDDEQEGH